jgi:hypothetical protein
VGNKNTHLRLRGPLRNPTERRDGPKAPTAVHGALGFKFDLLNTIADCLENQFTPHDVCDKNDDKRVEGRVECAGSCRKQLR